MTYTRLQTVLRLLKQASAPPELMASLRYLFPIHLFCCFPREPAVLLLPSTQLSQPPLAPVANCGLLLLCLSDCSLPEGRGVTHFRCVGGPQEMPVNLFSPVSTPAHYEHLHESEAWEEGRGPVSADRPQLAGRVMLGVHFLMQGSQQLLS